MGDKGTDCPPTSGRAGTRFRSRFTGIVGFAALVGALAGATQVAGDVSPPSHSAELAQGESTTVTKTVDVPVPSKLDFVLDVDNSGSYGDDLPNIQSKAPEIFDRIRSEAPDSQFGLITFVDFPFSPWGGGPDYGYMRNQALTSDRATWLGAVNAMTILGGGDFPESQYESLFQAATGDGRQMPPTTDGDFSDPGEIPPGQDAGFRPDAARVIAITTDAAFHVRGDPGSSFPYPGPTRDQAVNALNDNGIAVIAIKAPGSESEMDDLASATGGAVVTTDASSTEIADAIISGLRGIRADVTATPVGCDGLDVTFDPPAHQDVEAGGTVQFSETITRTTGDGGVIRCTVQFKFGDAVIGEQTLEISSPSGPSGPSGPSAPSGASCPKAKGGAESASAARRATIVGTPGPDVLKGTAGDDVILGRAGGDVIKSKRGDDVVCGQRGKDKIGGGKGKDKLRGGKAKDRVNGHNGKDGVKGDKGRDKVLGGKANDKLRGGLGKDLIRGRQGNDLLRGRQGNDLLDGGPGDNRCRGGGGKDSKVNC